MSASNETGTPHRDKPESTQPDGNSGHLPAQVARPPKDRPRPAHDSIYQIPPHGSCPDWW